MLFLGKSFNMRIVNNRKFYLIKKKQSIIIWSPTVKLKTVKSGSL